MKRKIISSICILITAGFLMVTAGCGGGGGGSSASSSSSSSSASVSGSAN